MSFRVTYASSDPVALLANRFPFAFPFPPPAFCFPDSVGAASQLVNTPRAMGIWGITLHCVLRDCFVPYIVYPAVVSIATTARQYSTYDLLS